ncbi:MAG: molybdopterin molybdotransferase MoeA [Bacteroidota bacterium]
MITVADATDIVLSHLYQPTPVSLPLNQCSGRILQEDLVADRDFPPFNRATRDGIALNHKVFANGRTEFRIQATAGAGSPQLTLQDQNDCIEIMTGAILPLGCDSVIRYEDLDIADGMARVRIDELTQGQAVHPKGSDRKKGDHIVYKGSFISPAEVGVAATIGRSELLVSSLPRTMLISTGDELVPISHQPEPYQIRQSNTHKLQTVLAKWGIQADMMHFSDDPVVIEAGIKQITSDYDLIIISGGVSKGKYDYLPNALDKVGVEKYFHRVRQRPGKPFWFGAVPNEATIFALPGNPVSSFVCAMRYLQPWLRASLGQAPFAPLYAELAAPITFTPELTYFAQVLLSYTREGKIIAHPVEGHGSGDLANLTNSSAFMELPQDEDHFEVGEVYAVTPFRG